MVDGVCKSISSQCPGDLAWNNTGCYPTSNTCPTGAYYNGVKCVPYAMCDNGKYWNDTLSQCLCPSNTFYNGERCVMCAPGQQYANGGCFCPDGTFFDGMQCQNSTIDNCISIPNSNWNGTHCICFPGFSSNG